jgi:hypothetical protein
VVTTTEPLTVACAFICRELVHVLFELEPAPFAWTKRRLRLASRRVMPSRALLARRGKHAALRRQHLLFHAQDLELLRCTLAAKRCFLLRKASRRAYSRSFFASASVATCSRRRGR